MREDWGTARRYVIGVLVGGAALSLLLFPMPVTVLARLGLFGLAVGALLYPRQPLLVLAATGLVVVGMPDLVGWAERMAPGLAARFWQPVLVSAAAATLVLGLPREIKKLLRRRRYLASLTEGAPRSPTEDPPPVQ
jgi:predicted acyltransferase